jgi:hypothetical protein
MPTDPLQPLNDLFLMFKEYDPKRTNTISFENFNKLSQSLNFAGENLALDIKFQNNLITFAEILRVSGIKVPQLPVSWNIFAEAFRKTDSRSDNTVNYAMFGRKLAYYVDVVLNPEDTLVSFALAAEKAAGPRQVRFH